jgi:pimeloyl-ACP methyl ester carboxylesterase
VGDGLDEAVARARTRVAGFDIESLETGSGPPVVLVHGLAGSHRWWRRTVPALRPRFRVLVPELVGFGGSRPAPRQPSVPELAELLAEWILLRAGGPAHVVGHSLGGQLAIHMAARRGECVDRLVLVDAAGVPRRLTLAEAARFLGELAPPRAWGAPGFLPIIAADALRAGPRVLLAMTRSLLADDVRPLLPLVRSRTLVVWGRLDPLLPLHHARELARGIAGARLVVLPLAGHNPMVDRPEAFNDVIAGFLAPRPPE